MKFDWVKRTNGTKVYPIAHANGVLCGDNADKTLTEEMNDRQSNLQNQINAINNNLSDKMFYKDYGELNVNGDANNYTESGVLMLNSYDYSNLNFPHNWGVLVVDKKNGYISQTFNGTNEKIYKRFKDADWTDWQQLAIDSGKKQIGYTAESNAVNIDISNFENGLHLIYCDCTPHCVLINKQADSNFIVSKTNEDMSINNNTLYFISGRWYALVYDHILYKY